MTSAAPHRRRVQSARAGTFLLAFLLPLIASWADAHVPGLRVVPFATHFLALITVAALGGAWPALLAICVSFACRNLLHIDTSTGLHYLPYSISPVAVLSSASAVVVLTRRRLVRSRESLRIALEQLQLRTSDLVDILASSKCACWTFDLNSGKSPRWFRGSYPIFGRSFEELEAMPSMTSLLHPDDQPRVLALAQQMRTTWEPTIFEYRCEWPDGELHTLEMRGQRMPGKGCIWRGVTLDISERKLTETSLLRVEKLAAMGRLASTVAHEINNPLESVTNLLYLVGGDETLSSESRNYLTSAERELARLTNITRLTLGFVRVGGESVAVEMANVVDEVLSIFQHRLEARKIRLERRYEPGVRVMIAPHELRQIVTNLVANAADALHAEHMFIAVHIRTEAGRAVLLAEDNGEGIAAADMQRIFEAFYSTRQEVGTGIGLWVTKELAEKNGGQITVESVQPPATLEGGVRTRFRLELPLADERTPAAGSAPHRDGVSYSV